MYKKITFLILCDDHDVDPAKGHAYFLWILLFFVENTEGKKQVLHVKWRDREMDFINGSEIIESLAYSYTFSQLRF